MYKYVMGWENRGSSFSGSILVIGMVLFYFVEDRNFCLNVKEMM
jgi:hypothetical protein